MAKGKTSAETRLSELKKMSGTDFALEVTKDLVMLQRDERATAIRMLTALDQTINRETEAVATR